MDNDMVETVYGTHEDSQNVMSEKVQSLASSIYKEFERMIKSYDENVVKELMPLVVGILESLDMAYIDKQECEVELELLRDDNEQLLTQYEREKQLRKTAEQKFLEVEDSKEEERKDLQDKVESLESIVRMLELKAKNSQDHISRLEDKESETRKDHSKLHERYTELFKTHMDYMERTKLLLGTDRIMEMGNAAKGKFGGMVLPNLKAVTPTASGNLYGAETPGKTGTSPPSFSSITSPSGRSQDSSTSLRNELKDVEGITKQQKNTANRRAETAEKEQSTDPVEMRERNVGTKENAVGKEQDKKGDVKASSDKNSDRTPNLDSLAQVSGSADSEKNLNADKSNNSEESSSQAARDKAGALLASKVDYYKTTVGDALPPSVGDVMATSPDLDDFDDFKNPLMRGAQNESSIYDELAFNQDALGEVDEGLDITGRVVNPGDYSSSGMGKEVENLILENTELLATKNALNVVKDDLIAKVDELTSEQEILREEINSLQAIKTRLQSRITELEDEVKKFREELEKAKSRPSEEDDQDDVPMAQRKRFTRVEMARVLMERNQYKERLMELQEAVRWTEMIRASREHPDIGQGSKKKSSIWNFFSNLFATSSNKPSRKQNQHPQQHATVRYNAPTSTTRPVGDPNKKQRDSYNLGEKAKAYDFLQDDLLTEKKRKEREKERRDQYKQVQVHVKKDDGRMQAYGWSLPAKFNPPTPRDGTNSKHQVPVPVPVYCRPLSEKDNGMKIWCAAGVNLLGGKTRDGGNIVGASVFYSNLSNKNDSEGSKDDVDKLDKELKEHEKAVKEADGGHDKMSSMVWICTTTQQGTRVFVIDANNPADVLDAFHVTSSHILCISSVPGALEDDYPADDETLKADIDTTTPEDDSPTNVPCLSLPASNSGGGDNKTDNAAEDAANIGNITFVQCATGRSSQSPPSDIASPLGSPPTIDAPDEEEEDIEEEDASSITETGQSGNEEGNEEEKESSDVLKPKITKATGSPATSANPSPSTTPSKKRLVKTPTELVKDGISSAPSDGDAVSEELEKMSSVQPTMWMGTQSGSLYVHSAVTEWKRCLHSVKLKDSVLSIIHVKGRVLVGLADGTVAIFHRAKDGQWDLANYYLVDLGKPHHSIRCMTIIANKHVWCGYRNKVHVLDPKSLKLVKSFDAHPRKESQVRQLAWVGDGVWVSIRLDSTLRLYHAYTHQHLQDVDIEPYVSKMLGTGKLGFSFVRITSLLISCHRLWIGTGNGVVISVPLSENNKQAVTTSTAGRPGGVIRVYSDTKTDSVTPGTFLPYCSMSQAQLSFHGHRDAVKFFVSVPGAPQRGVSGQITPSKEDKPPVIPLSKNMLVISGGEGYIDFRLGDTEEDDGTEDEKKSLSKGERSHLIVWHLSNQL